MVNTIISILISTAPIWISFLALVISIIALWKTSFSKFNPLFTAGELKFRIYPIRNGKEKWFVPSIDLPISVANDGARPGLVLDSRIIIKFPQVQIKDNYEIFPVLWEVDGMKFRQADQKNRFKWIDEVVSSDWMPFIVLPKETKTKHLIFETRWNEPVIQDEILFVAEILTDSSKKWKKIAEWRFNLNKYFWSELTERGTAMGAFKTDKPDRINLNSNSKDLRKYTGPKEEIPSGGFKAKPSYLDFPKQKRQ